MQKQGKTNNTRTILAEQMTWRKRAQIIVISVLLYILTYAMIDYLTADGPFNWIEVTKQGAFIGLFLGLGLAYTFGKFGKRVTSQIFPDLAEDETIEVEGPANLFKGFMMSVGGKLFITNKKVIFKTHKINIQRGQTDIAFDEIAEVSTRRSAFLFSNGIRIKMNSGDQFDFVVHERDTWVELLEGKLN